MITPVLFEKTFPEGIFRVYDGDPHQSNVLRTKQTHSNKVLNVMVPDLGLHEADGLYGEWQEIQGQILMVKTADCLPVLLLGAKGAAMIHAGWKGLATGILKAQGLQQLSPSFAFIGPCIHACSFEVTSEFRAHFPDSPFFSETDGKMKFDLVAEARRQLEAHYPGITVEDSGVCTYCETTYSSFRRDKTTRRIWNCFLPLAR